MKPLTFLTGMAVAMMMAVPAAMAQINGNGSLGVTGPAGGSVNAGSGLNIGNGGLTSTGNVNVTVPRGASLDTTHQGYAGSGESRADSRMQTQGSKRDGSSRATLSGDAAVRGGGLDLNGATKVRGSGVNATTGGSLSR